MNETITYHVTPEMQNRAMKDYFWGHAIGRRWYIVLAIILSGLLLLHPGFSDFEHKLGVGFLLVGVFFVLLYFKSYQQHLQMATDALNLHDSTDVSVVLSDDTITIVRAESRQQVEWNRVTSSLDSRDSLILFSNKMPVCNLPKQEFTTEQLEFIRKKSGEGPTPPYFRKFNKTY